MATKKNMRISYPSSEKIYVPGEINKIKVGMRKIKLLDTVTLDEHGERIFKKNNPVIVYDTSGPYSDPPSHKQEQGQPQSQLPFPIPKQFALIVSSYFACLFL